MDKIFWVDSDISKNYRELIVDLNILTVKHSQIYEKNSYQIILKIVHSLMYDYPIVLFDSDFSNSELKNLGYDFSKSGDCDIEKQKSLRSLKDILDFCFSISQSPDLEKS